MNLAKPSLLESRRRQRLLEPRIKCGTSQAEGERRHLKPAFEGFSGLCVGMERGPRFFVPARDTLQTALCPASKAIKACVGKRSPSCLAKSALPVSKRNQRGKRNRAMLFPGMDLELEERARTPGAWRGPGLRTQEKDTLIAKELSQLDR